jgi:apolipoprotein N-acyltransferase
MTARRGRRILLPLAGGALGGVSLPPLGWWPLGVLGLALVAAALQGQRARARLLTGLLAGIGQFFVALAWALQFNTAGYVVLAIVEACFLAAAALLVAPGPGQIPAFAGAVTLGEWARQHWPFGGLPLGGLALGQIGGPLGYTARIGGGLLVVGVTALAGASLAALVSANWSRLWRRGATSATSSDAGPGRAAGRLAGLAGLVAVMAVAIAGVVGPDGAPGNGQQIRLLRVAIIQGGGKRGLNQLQVPPIVVYRAAVRATSHLNQQVDLILWPEDVVAMNGPFQGSARERQLAAIARHHRATLLAGVTVPVGATRFRNEIVAFSPTGQVVDVFEKVHRVPFGEYVPWRGFFEKFANLRDVSRDAIAGNGSGLMTTPAGRFAVLVSYEVFFADRGRAGVRAGGQVILVPTNTSSYSNGQAPSQEIAASRLQALEEGRYLLQAAPTGYSAVIDNSGDVLERTGLSEQAIITAAVPVLSGATVYERLGDLPVILVALACLAGGWLLDGRLTRRVWQLLRRRRSPSR